MAKGAKPVKWAFFVLALGLLLAVVLLQHAQGGKTLAEDMPFTLEHFGALWDTLVGRVYKEGFQTEPPVTAQQMLNKLDAALKQNPFVQKLETKEGFQTATGSTDASGNPIADVTATVSITTTVDPAQAEAAAKKLLNKNLVVAVVIKATTADLQRILNPTTSTTPKGASDFILAFTFFALNVTDKELITKFTNFQNSGSKINVADKKEFVLFTLPIANISDAKSISDLKTLIESKFGAGSYVKPVFPTVTETPPSYRDVLALKLYNQDGSVYYQSKDSFQVNGLFLEFPGALVGPSLNSDVVARPVDGLREVFEVQTGNTMYSNPDFKDGRTIRAPSNTAPYQYIAKLEFTQTYANTRGLPFTTITLPKEVFGLLRSAYEFVRAAMNKPDLASPVSGYTRGFKDFRLVKTSSRFGNPRYLDLFDDTLLYTNTFLYMPVEFAVVVVGTVGIGAGTYYYMSSKAANSTVSTSSTTTIPVTAPENVKVQVAGKRRNGSSRRR